MSRVRWAVRCVSGCGFDMQLNADSRDHASDKARYWNGKVVRITSYSPAETAARRAVIEAARVWCAQPNAEFACGLLVHAVQALEALERKEAKK